MAQKFRTAARVTTAPGYASGARKMRRPQHTFQIESRPYQIVPFFIAPVLPGESLKTLLWQARVVSDPLANPLIGWWQEYYFFYVKLTDLDDRDTIVDMMTKNAAGPAPAGAASFPNYCFNGGIDWVGKCLKRVTEEYFRNEGEAWNDFLLGSYPTAGIKQETFLQSLTKQSNILDDVPGLVVGGDDTITAEEVQNLLDQWQLLKDMNLTDMTYDDYLATFGVRTEAPIQFKPEVVRYSKDWTYPTNTVDPATGTPSSAVSWSVNQRADKNRYFKEPGFLFGVSITRAKLYMKEMRGAGVGMMKDAMSWLPAMLHDKPDTSILEIAEGAGPVPVFNAAADNQGYWIDVRDLLIYGDQFMNFDWTASTVNNVVNLPTAEGQHRYVDSASVDALFKGAAKKIRQDGLVSLHIAGRQTDTTPGVPSINV